MIVPDDDDVRDLKVEDDGKSGLTRSKLFMDSDFTPDNEGSDCCVRTGFSRKGFL